MEFKKAVDKLYAQPMANHSNSDAAPIQIMTIHKSKGLEFDQVILPNLTQSPRSDDNPLLRWQEQVDENNNTNLLLATLGPYDEDDNDPIYSYLKHEQRARSLLENTRVLYVAATRAIHKLHLFAELKAKKEGWEKPTATSLLSSIWPSIEKNLDKTGYQIKIGKIDSNDCQIFDSGTSLSENGKLLTDGGRVLSVVCQAKDFDKVFEKAYKNLKEIDFEGIFYRNDIGHQVRKNFSKENKVYGG